MDNVKIRDIKAILTQPPRGGRFTVVKVETTEPELYGLGDASYRTRPLAIRYQPKKVGNAVVGPAGCSGMAPSELKRDAH